MIRLLSTLLAGDVAFRLLVNEEFGTGCEFKSDWGGVFPDAGLGVRESESESELEEPDAKVTELEEPGSEVVLASDSDSAEDDDEPDSEDFPAVIPPFALWADDEVDSSESESELEEPDAEDDDESDSDSAEDDDESDSEHFPVVIPPFALWVDGEVDSSESEEDDDESDSDSSEDDGKSDSEDFPAVIPPFA